MANVLFIKGNTATINGTAIADGQLLWNTVTGEIWEDVGRGENFYNSITVEKLREMANTYDYHENFGYSFQLEIEENTEIILTNEKI